MTTPVILLRPEPGNGASLAAARNLGLDARGFALFAVEPVAWEGPDPATIDALLIGSANAPRHAGARLDAYLGKPAYVVGEATARACEQAGLAIAASGEGGLQPLLAQIAPDHRRLLRIAGAERVELVAPPDVTIMEAIAYASQPQPMPAELANLLTTSRPLVLLHSAEAARHFAAECQSRALVRSRITVATLGPRITQAAGHGWAAIHTANQASDKALLALAKQLCQTALNSHLKTG